MTDEDSDQDDSDGATLQLLTQEEETAALSYSELDDLNMWKAKMTPLHFCHSKSKMDPSVMSNVIKTQVSNM